MPQGPMGFSFQPGADVAMGPNAQAGGRSLPTPQESVKVLSFRMPKRDTQGAIAPQALLQASGAGGVPTGGLSPQLLALLLRAFSVAPQAGGGGGMASPGPFSGGGSGPSLGPPRVTPGDVGDRIPAGFPSEPGLQTGPPEFFDRSQPAAPPMPPQGPTAQPQTDPFPMGMDYQTYGMMPDLFR